MPLSRRRFLALAAASPAAYLVTGCLGSDNPEVTVTADGSPVAGHSVAPAAVTATPQAYTPPSPRSNLNIEDLTGFTMPVEGACLPTSDQSLPGASRETRPGVHEGIDFVFGDACVEIGRGTPVLAMYRGVVIRADHNYEDLTADDLAELEQVSDDGADGGDGAGNGSGGDETADEEGEADGRDEQVRDAYRGRQVWIDHGNDVVTRYCLLDSIESHIVVGIDVEAGDVIGGAGESGTPESVTASGNGLRLHAEVRAGSTFLGDGHDPDTVRSLYERLFTPEDDGGDEPAEAEDAGDEGDAAT